MRENVLYKEVATGARGKISNLKSVLGTIGQLSFRGGRAAENYNKRSTAHYLRYSTDPRARGYVPNSYRIGLPPSDFVLHCIESRIAIVTRAVTTAEAGTNNRKNIKNMEGLHIDFLRRARRDGAVIEMLYGGDGVDARHNNRASITIADPNITYETLHNMFLDVPDSVKEAAEIQFECAKIMRTKILNIMILNHVLLSINFSNEITIPYNLDDRGDDELMSEDDLIKTSTILTEYLERLGEVYYGCYYKGEIFECHERALTFIKAHIVGSLNISQLIKRKWSFIEFTTTLEYIKFTIESCLISYGAPIGALCSQGLSNPLTQFVIDAHHRSGVGGENKSLSRIKEIIQVKENLSNTMHIALREPYCNNESMAINIANRIRSVTIADFLDDVSGLIYGRIGKIATPKYKGDNSSLINYMSVNPPPNNITNKCFRLVLNLESMIKSEISVADILQSIDLNYYCAYVIRETNLVLYTYMTSKIKIDINQSTKLEKALNDIITTKVKGVEGIISVIIKKRKRHILLDDGIISVNDEFILETIGTNLRRILELPEVNPNYTTTTDINEITNIFGVTVAKGRHVAMYTEQLGDSINFRHYNLVANEISATGTLTGITSKGAIDRGSSILQSISDEKPLQILVKAAFKEMSDNITGVSPNIVLGQPPKIGNNYSDFMLDLEFSKVPSIDDLFNEFN